MRSSSLLCCVVLVGACGGSATETPAPEEPASGGEEPKLTRASHMQTSFGKATDVRDAIVAGDLDGAKAAATEINAQDHYAVLPKDWKGLVERVRQHADDVALAPDLPAAAQGLAKMANACGTCHEYIGDGPAALEEETLGHPERGAPDLATRMKRHSVAADELWLGMVKPSEKLWKQGSVTLTRAELAAPTKDGVEVDEWLAKEIAAVRDDALAARDAATHEARAESYGKLLARCGDCHGYVRK